MADIIQPVLRADRFWAIQLTNTEHRRWNSNEKFDELTFHWEDIKVSSSSSYPNITIAVTKTYPNYDLAKISSIAYGIYHYSRLREGDAILGVKATKEIHRVGYVAWNELNNEDYQTKVKINWIATTPEFKTEKELFIEHLEIQKLNYKILAQLTLPFELDYFGYEAYDSAPPRMRDKLELRFHGIEAISKRMPRKIKEISPKKDRGGYVSLFFGTNREKTNSSNPNHYFGSEKGKLQLGMCQVSIPKGHIQGVIEQPNIWHFEFSENPDKHVTIRSITELNEQEFVKSLSECISVAPQHDAFIFIHGYNVTFAKAARRAAQIAYDLPFEGASAFFSWPSDGKILGYGKDLENAEWSIQDLEAFIEIFLLRTKVERLHLVAHSLGGRLMSMTLQNLANKTTLSEKLNVIKHIILGAPDIDRANFEKNLLPTLRKVGKRKTLYSSDYDEALHLSEGLPRLGEAGDDLFVAEGLDTIDASNIRGGIIGHSYVFDSRELLSDLYYLITNDLSPRQRRLRSRKWKESLFYWLFPE